MTAEPRASRSGGLLPGVLKDIARTLLNKLRSWTGKYRRRSVRRLPSHILRDIGADTSGMDGFNQRWIGELQARLEREARCKESSS